MKRIVERRRPLTELIRKETPAFNCMSNQGFCIYFVPKEIPGEPEGRGLCLNPVIRENSKQEWIMDKNGLHFFIEKKMRNGKSKKAKADLSDRSDYIFNMSKCPGARCLC